ncbi:MAG: hypothetical protein LBJ91_02950 [Clostridiales Family XIII bacterium]|jgi:D-ribose pyranase|nr:hypothetical protein [Clostridiales Family XIII bacterium]
MKTKGILNPGLAHLVASMGHLDIMLIGDRGVPFPKSQDTVNLDLSIKKDMPAVKDICEVVLEELVIEGVIMPEETETMNPEAYKTFTGLVERERAKGREVFIEKVPHRDLKSYWLTGAPENPDALDTWGREIKGVVRTGEFSPYAYIMLVAGVDFS